MESTQQAASSRPSIEILRAIFAERFLHGFDVRFWDGVTLSSVTAERKFTLVVNSPSALRTAFTPPLDRNFGAAFAAGLIDIEGDIVEGIRCLVATRESRNIISDARLAFMLLRAPRNGHLAVAGAHLSGPRHSKERDRAAISYHYDQPIDFYRSFLDRNLVYSCAYFDEANDLDLAQEAKLDHVLAKLRLESGMSFLDIGCGCGALVIRAAERGATAHGITLSNVQYEEANRRIEALGLGKRATIELRDYRDITGHYDCIASIGMVEHVGKEKLREYYSAAFNALRPGGLFLNHGIAEQSPGRDTPRNGFINEFVFPDGDLVCIGDSLGVAERVGFEVRDVENLREHYARTLQMWVKRLEANRLQAVERAGLTPFRIWRLYMAGSAVSFENASIAIFQSLLAKPDPNGKVNIPMTRRDLYS